MVVIENWDFLIAEMAVLLGLAALVGLIAGLIMGSGRRKARRELEIARAELAACREAGQEQAAEIADLEIKLAEAQLVGKGTEPSGEKG